MDNRQLLSQERILEGSDNTLVNYMWCSLLLLLISLPDVEFEFLAFKDVAVNASRLAGAGRNAGEQAAGYESGSQFIFEFSVLAAALNLSEEVLGLLFRFLGGILVGLLLFADFNAVVLLVPLLEGGSVDRDDAVLNKSLSALEFVVSGVVLNFQDFGLPGHLLGAPREVAVIHAQSTELAVAATALDGADALGADLGVSSLAAHFEEALLLVDGHAASSSPTLVSGVTADTHLI